MLFWFHISFQNIKALFDYIFTPIKNIINICEDELQDFNKNSNIQDKRLIIKEKCDELINTTNIDEILSQFIFTGICLITLSIGLTPVLCIVCSYILTEIIKESYMDAIYEKLYTIV
jgi:hypothetical protein